MKKNVKLFVIYFPVMLVGFQVAVNLLSFIAPSFYLEAGFYLNTFFGTNVLFSLFLVAFTFWFKFCSVSRWAAVAEVLFSVNYLIVREDNLYNVMFQVVIGSIALIATFWHYIKKFPLCRMSLVAGLFSSVIKTGSCKKGIDDWDRNIKSMILKTHHPHERKN